MSYTIESIAEYIGARRVGEHEATIDWLLTDSRSLSFPEETLFFALPTKRNNGARYISELYDRGVRNFVVTEEDFKRMENGEWKMENAMQQDGAQPTPNSRLSILDFSNFLIVANPLKALKERFPQITEVELVLSKLNPPFGGDIHSASIILKESFLSV